MPPTHPARTLQYGRSKKKNIAVATWHAPLGRRDQEADLCRGQGFRRTAPPASPRSEDRDVQGPPGSEEKGILIWIPGSVFDEKAKADVDDRFPAAADPARYLQHHRVPDARRRLRDAAVHAGAGVGRRLVGDAERRIARARYPAVDVRDHQ